MYEIEFVKSKITSLSICEKVRLTTLAASNIEPGAHIQLMGYYILI